MLAFRAPQTEAANEPESQSAKLYVPSSQSSAVQSARSSAEINEITAEYAPQQQVVNGWLAADLLEVLADAVHSTADKAALVYAMEPVFAALFAWLWLSESLTWIAALGALLVVSAVVASEWKTARA